jgi:hypothetical protein
MDREIRVQARSLTLLYAIYLRCCRELLTYIKEITFDLLAFRFTMYAEVLKTGGILTCGQEFLFYLFAHEN